GDRTARIALDLASDPNRFLPTVQVGITLVGTFAAAFGGARLVQGLSALLADVPLVGRYAQAISLTLVAVAIAFVSLVLGELVPKRLALRNAEGLATLVAWPMAVLGKIARPAVWVLGLCTNAVLSLLRSRDTPEKSISLDDIQ